MVNKLRSLDKPLRNSTTHWSLEKLLRAHYGDCPIDHGERTNHKLRDQPYHLRDNNGKMRKW